MNAKNITSLKEIPIAVVCGGHSNERDVSLMSGENVLKALHRKGYNAHLCDPSKDNLDAIQMAFIALHGPHGEDGSIQGYFETKNIPYTGSGVTASAVAMDKQLSKIIAHHLKIPIPKPISYNAAKQFPIIQKPIREGSSIGVSIFQNELEFNKFKKNTPDYMLEEYIEGKEITVGVIEKDLECMGLPILELRPKNRFYDYEAKYTKGLTEFIIPAQIPLELTNTIHEYAIAIHKALGCRAFSRSDFIVRNNTAYFLEINTVPGMTPLSDIPAQAKAAGIAFDDLIELILLTK